MSTAETKQLEVVKQIDRSVLSVIGNKAMQGFEKAHVVSKAIGELKSLLTDEYMKPIMELQGNRLGFLTDKDKNQDGSRGNGYPVDVVRNCLIEAVLMGLQPTGNQFNIIAGNTYPTKEGCGYKLNNFSGLKYSIICSIPAMAPDGKSAVIDAVIAWEISGEKKKEVIPFNIKSNAYMGSDALVGKATRKARAWLLSALTGVEIIDGDITDSVVVENTQIAEHQDGEIIEPENHEDITEEIKNQISTCKNNEELKLLYETYPELKNNPNFKTALKNKKATFAA